MINDAKTELSQIISQLKNGKEAAKFLKDLCTPQEFSAMAERWRVCRLLHHGIHSYRDIHKITGASLTTIGRVARFLKDEENNGYKAMLKKMDLK